MSPPPGMRAMVLPRPGPVETGPLVPSRTPVPAPGPGQALLKVLACGVCHTDLHIVEGELELPRLPLIPGHEVVGIVVALGPDRGAEGSPGGGRPRGGSAEADASTAGTAGDEARVGDRVGVTWLYDACWDCAYCRRGLENLCPSVTFTGLDADGGYAEYMVAPARVLLPLPPGFSDIQASPLLCAGVIGYRALRLAGLQPGERLALFGFGASAHLALQVALHWGCEVYVYTRSPEHQAMARRLGAVWAGPAEAVLGPGRPPRVARAVSFAPSGSLIPLALQALEPAGVLAINAIHLDRVPDFPYRLLWGERVLRSVANVTRADGTQFLELAAEIPLSVETEVYDLEDANQVLLRLKRREIQGAAVLRVAGMGHGEA